MTHSTQSTQNIVIGFGKAGKTLAYRLAQAGQHVTVIEEDPQMFGGTCINVGCLPSKSLILSAHALHDGHDLLRRPPHDREFLADHFRASIAEKRRLTAMLRRKNHHRLADHPLIDVVTGHAGFVDGHTVRITAGNDDIDLHGERIFVNTGARPNIPPIDGIEDTPGVYTSTGLMELEALPQRLAIIGGGAIGLEFASMFAGFGSDVTVLQHGPRLLEHEDADMAQAVAELLRAQGVHLLTGADTQRVRSGTDGDGAAVVLDALMDGRERVAIGADAVLVATGRRPATDGLHAERAGVALDERGAVVVDDLLRTTADGIWAMGDVNGGPQHTYISLDDSRIVWSQLDGRDRPTTRADRGAVPTCMFLDTPYARVGLTEREARATGRNVLVRTMPVAAVPKAQVMRDTRGLMKAVVDADSHEILGAMLLAPESHEVINIVALAMNQHAKAETLRDMIFTHPTMAEALNDLFEW